MTRQSLLQSALDQYSGEIQGKVYQESPNEQGCLGVTAHPGVILRLICSAVDVAAGPAELPVRLMLRFGLILSFFQAFRLAIEGAANSHGQLKFHVALLNKYFSTHFRPLTESPHIVDNITGHHRVLRDIRRISKTHP